MIIQRFLSSTLVFIVVIIKLGHASRARSRKMSEFEGQANLDGFTVHCTGDLKLNLTSHKSRKQDAILKRIKGNSLCENPFCSGNSTCFLGYCLCNPGYGGEKCDMKLEPANMWYTRNCPNLSQKNTMDISTPLERVGGEYPRALSGATQCTPPANPKFCAYLCYSHNTYGTAIVPLSLWRAAQAAEGNLWAAVGGPREAHDSNDRAAEHWKAFDGFRVLAAGTRLGRVVEVGAGPWTQLKGILHIRCGKRPCPPSPECPVPVPVLMPVLLSCSSFAANPFQPLMLLTLLACRGSCALFCRPDLIVDHFTVWEPGASRWAHIFG